MPAAGPPYLLRRPLGCVVYFVQMKKKAVEKTQKKYMRPQRVQMQYMAFRALPLVPREARLEINCLALPRKPIKTIHIHT